MKNLISIIIPAYNTAKYIRRCIESVQKQTYSSIEIIVVDDGSTDNTLSILESIKDDRLRIIHKENGGVSSARNEALSIAHGKYIAFVDSDDWIEPEFISKHVEYLNGSDNTIVMSDFIQNSQKEHDWPYIEIEGTENIFRVYLGGGICNRIMNKVYPHTLLDNIPFPVGRNVMEDAVWTPMVMERCQKLIRLDYAGYHYERRPGSLTKHRLNSKEVAGMEANRIERDCIFLRNLPQDTQLTHTVVSDICTTLNSGCDLYQFGLIDMIRKIAEICLESNVQLSKREHKVLKIVTTSKRLYSAWFTHVLLHESIRTKIKIVRNYILYSKRTNKSNKRL